jgi:hypothetical protein
MSDFYGRSLQGPAAFISASCPGGMARQFRVQVASNETLSQWKLVGSFSDVEKASRCAAELEQAGQQARIVACRNLPTAA